MLVYIAHEIIGFLINQNMQKQDAEDIVQDIFVKWIQTDLVLPLDKLRPWLYRVAYPERNITFGFNGEKSQELIAGDVIFKKIQIHKVLYRIR